VAIIRQLIACQLILRGFYTEQRNLLAIHPLSIAFAARPPGPGSPKVLDIFANKGYKHYLGPLFKAVLQNSRRPAGYILVAALATSYGWMFLRGPQGFQTLIEKRREIRQLEERNANIRLENDRRKERIRRLQESRSEQEMEIRKQLKLQKPGETTFILPESEQKEKATPSPE
jgi:cell division protein FtsB